MTDIGANGQAVVLLTIAGRVHEVDAEIAPIVKALNDGGCPTVASCSGHGVRPGNIALADGRELIVAANYEEGRIVDKAFSSIETPVLTDIDKLARDIVERMTGAQKRALLPCADNRADLPKELIAWRTMPGHRFPSPKLSNLGYAARALVEKQNGR